MSEKLTSFDKRTTEVRKVVLENKGFAPNEDETGKYPAAKSEIITNAAALRQNILLDMKTAVKQVDSLRSGSADRRAVDISWGDYVHEKWGFAKSETGQPDSLYFALGINPAHATVESLMTMPDFDDGFRWIIPEIIREAVRSGLRRNPIYPGLIAGEESVSQPTITLPNIKMSDAMPKKIGEAETIPTGTVAFGQKSVSLQKIGTGLKLTDEVRMYVPINILGIYLEDVGVKMNIALDTMMIDVLINGDGNGNAAPVIGVETVGTWAYKDLLRAWIRMGLLGRMPQGLLSNENVALDILTLPEFRGYGTGIGPVAGNQIMSPPRINVRTPMPASQNYDVHGAMPVANQVMLVDNNTSLLKLNASALRVESERIAERQINGTYVSLVTGFAKLFEDGSLIIDKSLAYGTVGFPTWMNPSAVQNQVFKS